MEEKKENKIQVIIFWIISGIFLLATLISAVRLRYGNVAQFITYGLATICMCPATLLFVNKKIKKNVKWYIQIIVTIIIIAIGSLFFDMFYTSNSIKNEVLTSENYQEIMKKWTENVKGDNDDDVYFCMYSVLYYMTRDGLAAAFSSEYNENDIYKNIYGKTIQQLVDEGKKLMVENNITIEELKQEVKQFVNNQ